MITVGDLIARDRRSNQPAFESPTVNYDYRQFCTLAHKTGNYLSYFGVRIETEVSVFTGVSTSAAPIITLFGSSLLGATVVINPNDSSNASVVVAPAVLIENGSIPDKSGITRIAFDGDVDDPSVKRFGRGTWSENPACPQDPRVSPETTLVRDGSETYSHKTLLSAAESLITKYDIESSDRIVLRAPIDRPATIVGGIIVPLLVGASIVYADPDCTAAAGSIAIGSGDCPEPTRIKPDAISMWCD